MALPNILLVVLDDLGVEKFKSYGFESGTAKTPHFEALTHKGVLFERAYASPVCGPARSAIQTGRYAFRTGFGTNILATDAPPAYRLPTRIPSLPRMLNSGRPNTYATAAFGKWHLTYNVGDDTHPNDLGYGHFSGVMSNVASPGNGSGHFDWRRVTDGKTTWVTGPPFDASQWQASVAATEAKDWIEQQSSPWFAYVALNPPHAPFGAPPTALVSEETRAALEAEGLEPGYNVSPNEPLAVRLVAYDAMIEAIDTVLADLVSFADAHDALILVIGDNGTPADIILPPFIPQHAKRSVYEQGIHVPMLALGRGVNFPGRRTRALVHAVDMWRTVAEVAEANVDPNWPTIDSVSFRAVLHDPDAPSPRSYVFAEGFRPNGLGTPDLVQRTIVQERFKYVLFEGNEEFYDLPEDPLEQNNKIVSGLTKREQLILADMQATLAALLASP